MLPVPGPGAGRGGCRDRHPARRPGRGWPPVATLTRPGAPRAPEPRPARLRRRLPDRRGARPARPATAASPGSAWFPARVAGARQVVLLVARRARAGAAPGSAAGGGADAAPRAPAASHLGGAEHHGDRPHQPHHGWPPAEHGVVGYRVGTARARCMNVLQLAHRRRRRPPSVPAARFQPLPPFPGRGGPCPVVTRPEFGRPGSPPPTSARPGCTAGTRPPAWWWTSGGCSEAGEPFVYAYYDGIDQVAHARGARRALRRELRPVDRLVGDLARRPAARRGARRHRRPRPGRGGCRRSRSSGPRSWPASR